MSERIRVLNLLQKHGLEPIGGVVENPDVANGFLCFLKKTRDDRGKEQPSNRKLVGAASEVEEIGSNVSFVFLDERATDLSNAVQAMLDKKFSGSFESSVISLNKKNAILWVDLARGANDDIKSQIRDEASELLSFLGFSLSELIFSAVQQLPTATACISVLRKHAPLSRDELVERLLDAGFDRPTDSWLDKTLDVWRKRGLLYRRSDKRFVLTLGGLNQIGTRRNKTSPDVGHALAMARRR